METKIHSMEISFFFEDGIIPEVKDHAVVLPECCNDVTPSGSTDGDTYYEIRVEVYPYSRKAERNLGKFMDYKYGRLSEKIDLKNES